jgi:hydroxylamine dehydrogenase
MKRMTWSSIVIALLLAAIYSPDGVRATEAYARQTGKVCSFCHQHPSGGALNPVGTAFVRNNFRYPIPERILEKAHRISTPFHRTVRFIAGYLHLVTACIFVGTIFYIHIFVKPSRITGGIPRGERILGRICMATLAVTGIYLTWYRLDSPSGFFRSHFGLMLFIKIILFALMVVIAIFAITVIHRGMQKEAHRRLSNGGGAEVNRNSIHLFNGMNGQPAYVIYRDTVYDVTASPKWAGGEHFKKHAAGRDLTRDLEGAPHGDEVFAGLPVVARISDSGAAQEKISRTRKIFIAMAYVNLIITFLILLCVSSWLWGFPVREAHSAGGTAAASDACLNCHRKEKPGIYHDWRNGVHAKTGVGCADCHGRIDESDATVSKAHLERCSTPVSALVTPRRCSGCHPVEVEQYALSKHAHTLEIIEKIDKWLIHGMNNCIERSTGCFACHGSVVAFDGGHPVKGTWPNVGVGRINPDGSAGSCTSCHTRHRFSLVEARKPEACDQCHLGPDHPQIEIYNESKHGTIYHAEGDSWNWRPDDMAWRAGRDYRAPTCASCHMSAAAGVKGTHDVAERLSWELQAPLTVRPADFAPYPASTSWKTEREKMRSVCSQCHSAEWISGHFDNLDRTIDNYNEKYFKPVHKVLSSLYEAGFLSHESYFDESLEWEFYEFWHHEGRRARMGAAMMAPDYAWWHGFYELKSRYVNFMQEAQALKKSGRPETYRSFPGKFER